MTLIFEGTLEDFILIFGGSVAPALGEEFIKDLQEASKDLNGKVKMNISNDRYKISLNMEGDL